MTTITTQLADCVHGERLREADRARLAVGTRSASRSKIRQYMHVACGQAIIGYGYGKRG